MKFPIYDAPAGYVPVVDPDLAAQFAAPVTYLGIPVAVYGDPSPDVADERGPEEQALALLPRKRHRTDIKRRAPTVPEGDRTPQ